MERTIENNGYESDLQIKIMYKHNVSRKTKETVLNSQIDIFNRYNQKSIYELQFIQAEQDIKNKTTKEIQK